MSNLKISPNLFLEVNELERLKKSLKDHGYVRLLKSIINSYGIVKNGDNTFFKVTQKAGTTNTVIVNSGLAFDSNLDAIVSDANLEILVNDTGMKRWLILSRAVTNNESGTISVTNTGTITGVGTEFTKVLRGQPNFPTKVRFGSLNNLGDYEVVNVGSDTSAILAGSFVAESNLKYKVIGTFTPGFQPLDSDKLIYEYDSYTISVVDSPTAPIVTVDQFILSSIEYIADVMNVDDKRENYLFNNSSMVSGQNILKENPLASLLKVSKIENKRLECVIEHGYKISAYQLVKTSSSNTLIIEVGSSNFLGTSDIPDKLFVGWLLFNRKNMKFAVVDNNTNKNLIIATIDSSMIETSGNDLVLIPNYFEIEFEISFSGVETREPVYKKFSMYNIYNRFDFPITYGISDVTIKYRMLNNGADQTTFGNLAIAQFTNINNILETLANSNFNVNILEPVPETNNYS